LAGKLLGIKIFVIFVAGLHFLSKVNWLRIMGFKVTNWKTTLLQLAQVLVVHLADLLLAHLVWRGSIIVRHWLELLLAVWVRSLRVVNIVVVWMRVMVLVIVASWSMSVVWMGRWSLLGNEFLRIVTWCMMMCLKYSGSPAS
jgi:hypothetical protein